MDFDKCVNNVWFQKSSHGSNRFTQIMKYPNANDGYIFVNDDFNGFNKKELKIISRDGTVNLAIYKTSRSQHYVFSKMTPIKELKYHQLGNKSNEMQMNIEREINQNNEKINYHKLSTIVVEHRDKLLLGLAVVLLIIILGVVSSAAFSNNPHKHRH